MLRRWLGHGETRGLHPRDPGLASLFGAAEAASGMVVTPDTAMRATAVFACVQYLARSIAAMPLILYRRLPDGGKARDYEHPLARVLHDQPNSWQTAYEFRAMLQAHLSLRGNAYARIVAANGSPVAALLPLHPGSGSPAPRTRSAAGSPTNTGRSPGRARMLLQEEVLHLRGLSLAERRRDRPLAARLHARGGRLGAGGRSLWRPLLSQQCAAGHRARSIPAGCRRTPASG